MAEKPLNRAAAAPSNPEGDAACVAQARAGSKRAFQTLVGRHERRAYAVALGMMRNPEEALDIVQDAFLKAWRSLPTFQGEAAFSTWLHRIVVNLSIDRLRKRRDFVEYDETLAEGELETPALMGGNPVRALESKQAGQAIMKALEALSPAHRAVLVMREVEGMSYREMAQAMGCSEGTIMSRLFHARKRMQAALQAHGPSAEEPA